MAKNNMNYLASKSRNELLLIMLVIPVLGSLASYLFGIDKIYWPAVGYLIAFLWQMESILKLNRVLKGEFSLTITKIAFIIWIPLFLIGTYKFDPETMLSIVTSDYYNFFVVSGMIINLTYFYVIYILTRMYSRATTGYDLSGVELFPTYFYFLIYPIGIWKFQNHIQQLEKRRT